MAAALVAAGLGPAFDRWLPRPPTPPGHRDPHNPAFPSGHTLGPGAVALTSAYAMAREGRASPAVLVPIALTLPLVTVADRLMEQKHWASDVAGGYLGAGAVAAACLAGYEVAHRGRDA